MKNKAGSRRYNQPRTNTVEDKMIDLIDDIEAFKDFQGNILPALQADVKAGMAPADLRKKYASLIQARIITAALKDVDNGKALAAAKDILDRADGKAVEKKEIKHRLETLSDKELDAVLESEIDELEEMQQRFDS